MKFEFDWPSGIRGADVEMLMDYGQTRDAFCSLELKKPFLN